MPYKSESPEEPKLPGRLLPKVVFCPFQRNYATEEPSSVGWVIRCAGLADAHVSVSLIVALGGASAIARAVRGVAAVAMPAEFAVTHFGSSRRMSNVCEMKARYAVYLAATGQSNREYLAVKR